MNIFSFCVKRLDGHVSLLSEYSGLATVVVNTASQCSFTPANVTILREVQDRFHVRGFTVLAFPCSQFAAQEPLTSCQLEQWTVDMGLSFPIFDRVDVKGVNASPLFLFLQSQLGAPRWNYTKYVCDRNGRPIVKLDPSCSFEALSGAIERALA